MAEKLTEEQVEAKKRRIQWMMRALGSDSVPPPDNSKFTLDEEIALCDLALAGLRAREPQPTPPVPMSLRYDAAKAWDERETALAAPVREGVVVPSEGWISVNESLPEKWALFVNTKDGRFDVRSAMDIRAQLAYCKEHGCEVVWKYWMPLPAAPKEEKS